MASTTWTKHFLSSSRQFIHAQKLTVTPPRGFLIHRTGRASLSSSTSSLSSSRLLNATNSQSLGGFRCFSVSSRNLDGAETERGSVSPGKEFDSADIITGERYVDLQPCNFDFAKGRKQLYYEDGVPDVLYRRLELKCLAHESALLDSYQSFVEMTTDGLRIPVQVEEPCRVVERKTVLRSAFVHKDIRTQYEWYTHYRLFKFVHLTGSTADTLLEYLQRNMPEGMAMEVTKTRVERLPAGVEAAKGETPSKEEVFGGRRKYDVDSVKPYPKPDPAQMPDDWEPHSKDERFDPIPV